MEEGYLEFNEMIQENILKNSLKKPFECNTLMPHQLEQLIDEIIDFYKICNQEMIQKIQYIFSKLEEYHFFHQNIGLYAIGVTFAFDLSERFPNIVVCFDDILLLLVMSLLITNKFFIDECFTNKHIANIFQIDLNLLVKVEYKILSNLDFELPFTLFKYE